MGQRKQDSTNAHTGSDKRGAIKLVDDVGASEGSATGKCWQLQLCLTSEIGACSAQSSGLVYVREQTDPSFFGIQQPFRRPTCMNLKICVACNMEARVEESAAGLPELGGYLLYDGPSFSLRHSPIKTGLAFLHHMHGECNVNGRIAPARIPVKTIPLDYDTRGFVAGPGKVGDYREAQYGMKACSEIVQQSTSARFYAPVMRLDEGRYCPPCIEVPSKAERL